MSKSHAQPQVLTDVRTLSIEELATLYGIEIAENGSVFDPTEGRTFDDITEWAMYIAEQENEDNYSSFSKFGGRQGFDDDY